MLSPGATSTTASFSLTEDVLGKGSLPNTSAGIPLLCIFPPKAWAVPLKPTTRTRVVINAIKRLIFIFILFSFLYRTSILVWCQTCQHWPETLLSGGEKPGPGLFTQPPPFLVCFPPSFFVVVLVAWLASNRLFRKAITPSKLAKPCRWLVRRSSNLKRHTPGEFGSWLRSSHTVNRKV